MLIVMISSSLVKYFGKGPFFPYEGFETNCKITWWTNLLYINNLVSVDKMVGFLIYNFINLNTVLIFNV